MDTKKSHIENDRFLADWLADKITDDDLKRMVSKEDFIVYVKIKQYFEKLEKLPFETDKAYAELKEKLRLRQTKVRSIPNWVYTVAALFVLFFGVFRFFQASIEVTTSFGQTKEIALNEGTQIHLNAKSSVVYPKYQAQRNISLKGEAFFDVTKKGAFTVTTPMGIVQVLGTKFNVIANEDIFEVICYEGSVKVMCNGQEKVLKPNDAWRVVDGDIPKEWKTTNNKAGWLLGETNFKSMPVKFVMKAIENQYDIKFKAGSVVDTLKFTGSFPNDNLKKALRNVCLPLGLDFEIKENNIVLLSEK
jgi:ferric-dicitrate binding protein FerR (iron transport regulator)